MITLFFIVVFVLAIVWPEKAVSITRNFVNRVVKAWTGWTPKEEEKPVEKKQLPKEGED